MRGDLKTAVIGYRKILQTYKNHADTIHHLGIAQLQLGNIPDAVWALQQSISINPQQPNTLSNLGYCLNLLGRYPEAMNVCNRALKLDPRNDGAWTNLGNAQKAMGLAEQTRTSYLRALNISPHNARYLCNLASVLYEQEKIEEAIEFFEKAIAIDASMPEANASLAACFIKIKKPEAALEYLNSVIRLKPDYAEAWSNRGAALHDLKRHEEALASYERVIELKPDYAEAWNNRGNVLGDINRYEEALANYGRAIELKSDYAEAWSNRGNTLGDLRRYEEALESYERAFALKPDVDFLFGQLLHTQMRLCNWSQLDGRIQSLREGLIDEKKVSMPFPLLGLVDEPKLHQLAAEVYAQDKFSFIVADPIPDSAKPASGKIHIGYYSADFREHAVAHLTAELFELHDKSRFEITGFYFGPSTNDEMHQRISNAFDRFVDIRQLSDRQVVQMSRDLHVDIAIDLTGYTTDSRVGIFAHKAAPIQVNFLGYAGTMGLQAMDYIIADRILIPEEQKAFYAEKIAALPHTFMPNDCKKPIAEKNRTKVELGLPDQGHVFACFNNGYKINPDVLDSWAKILLQVPGSVLWLSKDNDCFEKNLRKEIGLRGVDAERVIFAGKTDLLADHLARIGYADLFLDTLPYNAHTTASDALWAGLPVLTRIGESFPARVAASLLTAIDLPELITTTKDEYEAKAIELATNPDKLAAIKQKLTKNRLASPLFDTASFTRHLEAAYAAMYARHQAGLPPDHICIAP